MSMNIKDLKLVTILEHELTTRQIYIDDLSTGDRNDMTYERALTLLLNDPSRRRDERDALRPFLVDLLRAQRTRIRIQLCALGVYGEGYGWKD